jgi:osmotically-inducible protein OsmY
VARGQPSQIIPKPGPTPAPVARLDADAARGIVEEKLRAPGLLEQSGGTQWGVTVDITGGGVTLTGVLQNNQQRNDTVRLAAEVPGVTEVVQRIDVQQSWNTR